MADLVRAYDWASTSLGPIESWSIELITIVNLTLCSPSPARTMWGPELILIYNDAYRPIPGRRHPDALGKPAHNVYAEAWHVVGPLLEHAILTGETCFYPRLAVPLLTESGEVVQDRYLDYSFNPIYENGKIGGLFGHLHDATGEVLATRKLQESEARALRILQSIGDAVIVTDVEGRITRMNPIAESLTGWTADQALGRPLSEVFNVVSEATGEPIESPAAKVKRLGSIVGLANHTILRGKDGTETYIDDSGAPILNDDGELTGIVLVFRNINERRAAEQEEKRAAARLQQATDALRASEEELRWTIDLNPQISWTADLEANVLDFGDRWLSLTGLTREEALGQGWIQVPHPEDLPRLLSAVQHSLATGAPFDVEHRIKTASGDYRWMRSRAFPRRNASGAIFKWHGTTEDIEERKRAEQALIQSEKLAAVGRLASSIAHEINNPLEAVTNLIYLARLNAVNPETIRLLETADQEIRRAAVITSQTLRFHKQPSNPQPVLCSDLFETVLSIYEGRLKNSNIVVEQRLRCAQPVLCFEGDIRQVLNNLVGNAIDAMPTGGRLMVRNRLTTHWPTGRRGLALTVADTGNGMPPDIRKRIFDPFFTTKGIGGTGLGLWVSQEITNRHSGALNVRSSQRGPQAGTVFTLFLPFNAQAE
jgi:PAS domain S-box-containing protein